MAVHDRMLASVPGYREARDACENRAWALETARGAPAAGTAPDLDVVVIPIVVHVVANEESQDLSDEQVTSQVDALNRDYRMTNTDLAQVPEAFSALAADVRLEFSLATTDPSGSPTAGITRTRTERTSFGDDDAVKSATSGGADPWPSDRYLNIWTCPALVSASGVALLGYAQFPGGPPQTDGVVIWHAAFGTTGTAAAPFDLGRTSTHEVGHWLNLRHVWGDDGTGCAGSDFVSDTPNQGGPNYGRPAYPHLSCNNGPDGDMFMNYLDYVDDAAMVMFTHGQVTRMRAALAGDRATIGQHHPAR
jgi:hypothetical protein